ncbi:MAG: TOBE domain-containing protein, partial [Planctomycetes bacterium]|nr:TOBE domain-containing protein [Planctomycetota bacterium]
GSPAMNFFNGTIQFKGDNVYCVIGDDIILLRPRMRAILAAYKDKQIVFGIRPEHLSTRPINGQSGNTISCTVEMLEFIGDRIDLCLKNNQSDNFIARMDSGVDINVGRPLTMYIDLDKVHIFEQGEMGKNVGLDCTGL